MSLAVRRSVARPVLAALVLGLGIAALAPTAYAQSSGKGALSPYERETLDIALQKVQRSIEPSPEGKTVEALEVAPFEVFDEPRPVTIGADSRARLLALSACRIA